jgi:hypothetical protein
MSWNKEWSFSSIGILNICTQKRDGMGLGLSSLNDKKAFILFLHISLSLSLAPRSWKRTKQIETICSSQWFVGKVFMQKLATTI